MVVNEKWFVYKINGLLVDLDSNKIFDVFENINSGRQTDLEQENNVYLIDKNRDGKWDHAYNDSIGLLTYSVYVYQKFYPLVQEDLQNLETPGFELITLLAAIVILFIVFKRRK